MTDGQGAEPPKGTPGPRVLGALESAVRRARESAGAPLPPSAPATPGRPPPADPGPSPATEKADRWLIASVVVAAVLVLAAAIGLAVSLANGPRSQSVAPPPSTVSPPGHTGTAHSAHHPATAGGATTSTTLPSTPGGAPVISSINPTTGFAGEGIEITGSNFLSSNGQIVATFNGQVAATSCPSQNSCTVTVPPSTGSGSAQVTVTTAGGTSNAVSFTYH